VRSFPECIDADHFRFKWEMIRSLSALGHSKSINDTKNHNRSILTSRDYQGNVPFPRYNWMRGTGNQKIGLLQSKEQDNSQSLIKIQSISYLPAMVIRNSQNFNSELYLLPPFGPSSISSNFNSTNHHSFILFISQFFFITIISLISRSLILPKIFFHLCP
jgi:hypothetical protein